MYLLGFVCLFSLFSSGTAEKISDLRLCADRNCESTIFLYLFTFYQVQLIMISKYILRLKYILRRKDWDQSQLNLFITVLYCRNCRKI